MKNILISGMVLCLLLLTAWGLPRYQSYQQAQLAKDADYVSSLAKRDATNALESNEPKFAVVMHGWSSEIPNIEQDFFDSCVALIAKSEIWVGNSDVIIEENVIGSRPNNTILYAEVFNEEIVNQIKARHDQFPNANCL